MKTYLILFEKLRFNSTLLLINQREVGGSGSGGVVHCLEEENRGQSLLFKKLSFNSPVLL